MFLRVNKGTGGLIRGIGGWQHTCDSTTLISIFYLFQFQTALRDLPYEGTSHNAGSRRDAGNAGDAGDAGTGDNCVIACSSRLIGMCILCLHTCMQLPCVTNYG